MYSSASAESPNFLWIASDPLHQRGRVADERVGADPDRGVGPERLDEQGHPQVAAGLQVVAREDGEVGVEDLVEGQRLLGQPLVLAQVELARPAARCRGRRSGRARPATPTSPRRFLPNISSRLKTRSGLRRFRPETSLPRSPCTPRTRRRVPPLPAARSATWSTTTSNVFDASLSRYVRIVIFIGGAFRFGSPTSLLDATVGLVRRRRHRKSRLAATFTPSGTPIARHLPWPRRAIRRIGGERHGRRRTRRAAEPEFEATRHPPLAVPIRELGLAIAGSPLEPILAEFEAELEAAGHPTAPAAVLPLDRVGGARGDDRDRDPVLPGPARADGLARRAGRARRGGRRGRHPPLPPARDGPRRQLRLPALRDRRVDRAVRPDHPALPRGLPDRAVQPPVRPPPPRLVRPEASRRGLVGDLRRLDDPRPRLARPSTPTGPRRWRSSSIATGPWPRSPTATRS